MSALKEVTPSTLGRIGLRWRLYGFGVLQLAALFLGVLLLGAVAKESIERPLVEYGARIATAFAQTIGSPSAEVDRQLLRSVSPITLSIYAEDGALLLHDGRETAPIQLHQPRGEGWSLKPAIVKGGVPGHTAVVLADGRKATAVYFVHGPGTPPPSHGVVLGLMALALVWAGSMLIARTLLGPLAELVRAARHLGEGRLETRVHFYRRDELGEVADAFNQMAERIAQLLKAEKELLANVSHELRTPLARIRVAADLAAEGDAQQARDSFAAIAEDLQDLDEIIDNVLTAGRLEAGGLKRQSFSMTALLEQSIYRFRQAHPNRPLHAELPDEGPFVSFDSAMLRRAIDNVLSNADQYSEAQHPIVVRASEAEQRFVITIVDSGVGIAAEDVGRLFTPFFRADSSRARSTGGVGLGLALTRKIVEAHGGEVEVKSALGTGTTVFLRLPI